jgi:hypothetical protein
MLVAVLILISSCDGLVLKNGCIFSPQSHQRQPLAPLRPTQLCAASTLSPEVELENESKPLALGETTRKIQNYFQSELSPASSSSLYLDGLRAEGTGYLKIAKLPQLKDEAWR